MRPGTLAALVKVPNASGMMNPMGMVDMMKKNVTFMVPNMVIPTSPPYLPSPSISIMSVEPLTPSPLSIGKVMMQIINAFFQGFVLVKIPFGLTSRFKVACCPDARALT